MEIPLAYSAQAVKPRGANANEKLQYLINWYAKTVDTIDNPSWDFQRDLMLFTDRWGKRLNPLFMRETPEATKEAIINFLPVIEDMMDNSKKAADIVGSIYLYCELQNVVR